MSREAVSGCYQCVKIRVERGTLNTRFGSGCWGPKASVTRHMLHPGTKGGREIFAWRKFSCGKQKRTAARIEEPEAIRRLRTASPSTIDNHDSNLCPGLILDCGGNTIHSVWRLVGDAVIFPPRGER